MNIFDPAIWEGSYIDLWSIIHFISGMLIAFLPFFIRKVSFRLGFLICAIILLLWEMGELFFAIQEYYSNRLVDIGIGLVGYVLLYAFLSSYRKKNPSVKFVFVVYGILTLALSVFAWYSFSIYHPLLAGM